MKNVTLLLKAYGVEGEYLGTASLRYCYGEPGGPVWSIEEFPEDTFSITSSTDLVEQMLYVEANREVAPEPVKSGRDLFIEGVSQAMEVLSTLESTPETEESKKKLTEAAFWMGAFESKILDDVDCPCVLDIGYHDPKGSLEDYEDFDDDDPEEDDGYCCSCSDILYDEEPECDCDLCLDERKGVCAPGFCDSCDAIYGVIDQDVAGCDTDRYMDGCGCSVCLDFYEATTGETWGDWLATKDKDLF